VEWALASVLVSFSPTVLSTVALLRLSVVCTECIVSIWYVLDQRLLLAAYRKSYRFLILWENEGPWLLFRGRIKAKSTIALQSIRRWAWGYRGGSPTAVRPSDPALCGSCPL